VDSIVSPILLYLACGLGALGVFLALPKKTFSPFIIGGVVAALAMGLLLLGLGLKAAGEQFRPLPNYHFYLFSFLALASALRVITHPRPVYAALYFVLTVLASCGLYVILSAEFMAFALVIVYAGAILITYLFVIMLATEAPSSEELEALNEYDRVAREPLAATVAGFLLLAALTTIMAHGSSRLTVDPSLVAPGDAKLAVMPRKVEQILRDARTPEGQPMLARGERVAQNADSTWAIDVTPRTGSITVVNAEGKTRVIPAEQFPATLRLDNIEGVAFAFIGGHPGAIEIAGVILLMAMLGAVVLARKKVELDERALREHPHGPLVGGHTRLAVQGEAAGAETGSGGGRA
jgi:NADH-quinone oxidoreductase subunit J